MKRVQRRHALGAGSPAARGGAAVPRRFVADSDGNAQTLLDEMGDDRVESGTGAGG